MTQFGRALAELNIEILCANSIQAKGRGERANRTLQDRLVKELRMAGICDMAGGNTFLPKFLERFNEKFSVPAAKAENVHRRLNVQASSLADILCHREQRHLSQQLALAYDRRQIILERSELADRLARQYVEVYDFTDRPLEVRWKGHSLPGALIPGVVLFGTPYEGNSRRFETHLEFEDGLLVQKKNTFCRRAPVSTSYIFVPRSSMANADCLFFRLWLR
jgi:hypothetical protein